MKFSVDRIEGSIAVCEKLGEGGFCDIGLAELPEGVREGDCLVFENGEYTIDRECTASRKRSIRQLFRRLRSKRRNRR